MINPSACRFEWKWNEWITGNDSCHPNNNRMEENSSYGHPYKDKSSSRTHKQTSIRTINRKSPHILKGMCLLLWKSREWTLKIGRRLPSTKLTRIRMNFLFTHQPFPEAIKWSRDNIYIVIMPVNRMNNSHQMRSSPQQEPLKSEYSSDSRVDGGISPLQGPDPVELILIALQFASLKSQTVTGVPNSCWGMGKGRSRYV